MILIFKSFSSSKYSSGPAVSIAMILENLGREGCVGVCYLIPLEANRHFGERSFMRRGLGAGGNFLKESRLGAGDSWD